MIRNPIVEPASVTNPIELEAPGLGVFARVGSCALLLAALTCSAPPARALMPQNETVLPQVPMANDLFGQSMAIGALTPSSALDWIVVGRPGVLSAAGVVEAIPPLPLTTRIVFTAPPSHFQAGAYFGAAVAVADIDNDGILDIVVGAPGQSIAGVGNQTGRAFVFFGPWSPGANPPYANWCVLDVPTAEIDPSPEIGNHFGASLAVGQLDSNLGFDVVVGCPTKTFVVLGGGRRLEAGAADVFFGLVPNGGATPYTRKVHITDPTTGPGSASAGNHFGTSLAVGEFGNGLIGSSGYTLFPDIAVGVPDATLYGSGTPVPKFGAVRIYFGHGPSGGGGPPTWDNSSPFRQHFLGYVAPVPGNDFGLGTSLAAIDYDGDGWTDLAIGAPGSQSPCVELGHGSPTTQGLNGNANSDVLFASGLGGATRFGSSLAWMYRWGFSVPDLAVGTLDAPLSFFTEQVEVYQGMPVPFGMWTKVETVVDPYPTGSYPPSGFGTSIAGGQRGLSGFADLCIGSPRSFGSTSIRSGVTYSYWR
jgi:hypothetical protein